MSFSHVTTLVFTYLTLYLFTLSRLSWLGVIWYFTLIFGIDDVLWKPHTAKKGGDRRLREGILQTTLRTRISFHPFDSFMQISV